MIGLIYKIYFLMLNCNLLCIKNRYACVYNNNNSKYDFYYVQVPFSVTYFDSCPDKASALFKWKILLGR